MDYVPILEKYYVADIETETFDGKANPEKDVLKYFGAKTWLGKKIILHHSERDKIQAMLNHPDYIVGHNFKLYDQVVLERAGYTIPRSTIIIDTYTIADNRMKSMMYVDLNAGDRSLDSLLTRFNLPVKKLKFCYDLLKKDKLEGEEYQSLVEYLEADLDGADELFKYFYSFFYGFRQYMSEENQRRMCWLVNRPGSTAYKMICNMAKLPEEYDDSVEEEDDKYEGGFVSVPYCDYIEG